jgi:NAD-dependent SIR2 family protein deacetylase
MTSKQETIAVSLTGARSGRRSHGAPLHPRCLRCHTLLELHQPVIDDPSRLIGTCPNCQGSDGAWHVIDMPGPGHDDDTLIVLLPPPGLLASSLS